MKVVSATPMVMATAEFLKMVKNSVVSGGMMSRRAWGTMTYQYICRWVMPVDRTASYWPWPMEAKPARTCSATREAV